MKRCAREIDSGAVAQTIDHVRMAHAIQRHRFVLKIRNERSFKLSVGRVLKIKIQRFDDDRARRAFGSSVVVGHVDLSITAASEAFEDVIPPIESALLKFEFRHQVFQPQKGTETTKKCL